MFSDNGVTLRTQKVIQGGDNGHVGLARFPWLLPVRNSFAILTMHTSHARCVCVQGVAKQVNRVCVFITAGPITKLFAGGGEWRPMMVPRGD